MEASDSEYKFCLLSGFSSKVIHQGTQLMSDYKFFADIGEIKSLDDCKEMIEFT